NAARRFRCVLEVVSIRHMPMLGLAVFVLFSAGCAQPPGAANKPAAHVQEHADAGPPGGALADWGDERYHAEFTVDHGKRQATVYILDGSAKRAAPIDAETITLSLANVQPPVQVTLK